MLRDRHCSILRPCSALALTGMLACTSGASSETQTSESGSSSTDTDPPSETGMGESASTESETSESETTETETETGEMCTGIPCDSVLTLSFEHSLPLAEGPYQFTINTPIHEVLCSVGTADEGEESCFGFIFSDLTWDLQTVTLVMTRPFFDTDINPDATPFESVMLTVTRSQEQLFAAEIPLVGSDPIQPDPCGPICWEAQGSVTIE